MDDEVAGADAARGDAEQATPAWVADPDVDTGPVPVVTAEEAAAALAAHHTHVLHGHPHVAPPVHHEPPRHAGGGRRRTALIAGGVAAALLVVGGVSGYALTRGSDPATPLAGPTGQSLTEGDDVDAEAPLVPGISPSGSGAPLAPSVPTLVLGDSLGLTVYPWLADLLPDRYVSYEAEVGRTTAGTADALEAMTRIPRVVIVSSGTNDPTAAELQEQATRILDRLGTRRCVVWVDVVRPDAVGQPQDDLNAALDRAVAGRSNVSVLRWSEMIDKHPEWMSSDGVHPGQDGAQARAEAFAEASLACSPLDPDAPEADQQYLPSSVFLGPLSGQGSSGTGSGSGSGSGSSGSTRSPSASSTKKPKPTTSATPRPTSATPSPTRTAEPTPSPTKTSDPPPADPDPEDPPADA